MTNPDLEALLQTAVFYPSDGSSPTPYKDFTDAQKEAVSSWLTSIMDNRRKGNEEAFVRAWRPSSFPTEPPLDQGIIWFEA